MISLTHNGDVPECVSRGRYVKSPHLPGKFTVEQARDAIRTLTREEPRKAFKMFAFDDQRLYSALGSIGYYKPGKLYYVNDPIVLCKNGYHACTDIEDLRSYAPKFTVAVYEVLVGEVLDDSCSFTLGKIAGRYLYIGQRVVNYSYNWKSLYTHDYSGLLWYVDNQGIGRHVERTHFGYSEDDVVKPLMMSRPK